MDVLVLMCLSSEAYLCILQYALASSKVKQLAVFSYFKRVYVDHKLMKIVEEHW